MYRKIDKKNCVFNFKHSYLEGGKYISISNCANSQSYVLFQVVQCFVSIDCLEVHILSVDMY